jgi:light-regulated signal transduction histidine kinase (bacteriophytochrome)
MYPVWMFSNQFRGRIPVMQDVETEEGQSCCEVRLKHCLAELERSNREMEAFARVVAHDLQEPLRIVSGFLNLLEERYGDRLDEKAREYIGFAVDGAGRMQGLIQSLFDFYRIGNKVLDLAPVNLGELLDAVLMALRARIEESGARIDRGPLPELVADGILLHQVLLHLIGNALKFRGAAAPEVRVEAERKEDHWLVSVRDNGIGIEMAQAERIFEVFQRLHEREKYEGTGMGLAICKKIVERHGGRIWVESAPGQGSTFRFTLPLEPGRG